MNGNPFGPSPVETIVLRLHAGDDPGKREGLLQGLCSILPQLNWRAHLWVIDDPAERAEGALAVIRTVADYLTMQGLATMHVHPFVRTQGFSHGEAEDLASLLDTMRPFQLEAYEHQSEVRLLVLPVIKPVATVSGEEILPVVEFCRARLAKPGFYFQTESPLAPEFVVENDLRVYLDPAPEWSPEGVLSQLWMNHVFEGALERVEAEPSGLLLPCRKHLIVDEKDGSVFSCFAEWANARPLGSLREIDQVLDKMGKPRENTGCVHCISEKCLSMGDNLQANAKTEEGRQVCRGLGMALSEVGQFGDASSHARRAFELSVSDADRATALLHQGLCLLRLMDLRQAEEVLAEGASYSIDTGLFSYHRGRVQFAGGNYVEAINRFKQALAANSPEVSRDDVLFNLAVSYSNREQFGEAMFYLGQMEKTSAPMRFHQGICELGEGSIEAALERFNEALAMGPAPEDLSRVLFYIGTCLKETGRYDEAIERLERAVEADPGDYMNHNLLGFCFYQTKRYERAIASLHKAIEINPLSAIDYASLGSNLRELGRLEDAIAMYNMALSLDPDLAFARENITKLKGVLRQQSTE